MSLQFIIDGYNLIKHPLAAQAFRSSADSRIQLISLIKNKKLTGSLKNKVTIVFDGYPDSHNPIEDSGMDIVFSRRISADEFIKKILESYASKKNIVVVSDDREIKYFAKDSGAKALGIGEFIAPVSRQKELRRRGENLMQEEAKVNYTQMSKINAELKKLWLK